MDPKSNAVAEAKRLQQEKKKEIAATKARAKQIAAAAKQRAKSQNDQRKQELARRKQIEKEQAALRKRKEKIERTLRTQDVVMQRVRVSDEAKERKKKLARAKATATRQSLRPAAKTFANAKSAIARRLSKSAASRSGVKRIAEDVFNSHGSAPPNKKLHGDDGLDDSDEDYALLDQDSLVQSSRLLGGTSHCAQDKSASVAKIVGIPLRKVSAVVNLLEQGMSIPFIARYRKEMTGSMNENNLRLVERGLKRVDALETRRCQVTLSLHKSGKLTAGLRRSLQQASVPEDVEDVWAQFKSTRKTRADVAKEKGLEPLAELLESLGGFSACSSPVSVALRFVDEGRGVASAKGAMTGAKDIVAENIAKNAESKQFCRAVLEPAAVFTSRVRPNADPQEKFKTYWNFTMPMARVRPHQYLAVQRGETHGALSVGFEIQGGHDKLVDNLCSERVRNAGVRPAPAWMEEMHAAIADSVKRLLRPSLEREWRRRLRDAAEDDAFDTYRRNIHTKLLACPLRMHPEWGADGGGEGKGKTTAVLGMDPAYRTGCKLALVDTRGHVLDTRTIFPDQSPYKADKDLQEMLVLGLNIANQVVCSIGNGTASRETEAWVRDRLKLFPVKKRLGYTIVDEAGASVYSASPLAQNELPNLDVSIRGAASIARRLMDPLAELVKIDPKSIGVGLYQHDVNHKRLAEELQASVADCVNAVGVDVNTASPCLLENISGLGPKLARAVVEYRTAMGQFRSRAELMSVKGLGQKAYHLCSGFLRVYGGSEPLDATGIHPESYEIAKRWKARGGSLAHVNEVSKDWEIGSETLTDIAAVLDGSLQDVRKKQCPPNIKVVGSNMGSRLNGGAVDAQQIGLSVVKLRAGMWLQGVIRNVVAFGAFTDIGVGHDGLLHVSCYPPEAKRKPDFFSVNQRVDVWVESVTKIGGSASKGGGKGGNKFQKSKDQWKISLTAIKPLKT